VGPTLNLTKDLRGLLVFTPLTVPLDRSTPLTYNITIAKSSDPNNKLFSKTFSVLGEKLPLELIAREISIRQTSMDQTLVALVHTMLKRHFLRVMLLMTQKLKLPELIQNNTK
jgi:hypothetical protein